MLTESIHFVFAGGGRPGHFFPGVAVAEQLRRVSPQPRITFLGMGKQFERQSARQRGFEYAALRRRPPRGIGVWRMLVAGHAPLRAARVLLKQQAPSVVIGMGGEGSVPALRAAMSLELPIALLEQNTMPTPITIRFAPYASLICTAGDENQNTFGAAAPVRAVGGAIRNEFTRVYYEGRERKTGAARSPRLLVLTGVGPARRLNTEVPKALYKLSNDLRGWEIVHQSGGYDAAATERLYQKLGLQARVVPFVGDLARVLRSTDLVIGRAGGASLAELAAARVPAVLVPSSGDDADEQDANARYYVQRGACRAVMERGLIGRLDNALVEQLRDPIQNANTRREMSGAMHRLARPDAAWHVASMLLELARSNALEQVA